MYYRQAYQVSIGRGARHATPRRYFDDWVDLFEKLLSVDLVAVSRRMEAHNRERASVIAQSWEAVFDRVQALAPRPPANAIPCTCVAGSAERPQRRREREPSACCGRGGACSPARYSPSPTPHPLFYSRPPTHPHPTPNLYPTLTCRRRCPREALGAPSRKTSIRPWPSCTGSPSRPMSSKAALRTTASAGRAKSEPPRAADPGRQGTMWVVVVLSSGATRCAALQGRLTAYRIALRLGHSGDSRPW